MTIIGSKVNNSRNNDNGLLGLNLNINTVDANLNSNAYTYRVFNNNNENRKKFHNNCKPKLNSNIEFSYLVGW